MTLTKAYEYHMTESEEAVTRVLDAHWSAVKAKDADDVLVAGGLLSTHIFGQIIQFSFKSWHQTK